MRSDEELVFDAQPTFAENGGGVSAVKRARELCLGPVVATKAMAIRSRWLLKKISVLARDRGKIVRRIEMVGM